MATKVKAVKIRDAASRPPRFNNEAEEADWLSSLLQTLRPPHCWM